MADVPNGTWRLPSAIGTLERVSAMLSVIHGYDSIKEVALLTLLLRAVRQ